MLSVKQFRDGNRLVVVFEGLKDIPSEEQMIQNYLSSLVGNNVDVAPSVEAEPVVLNNEMPEIPKPVFCGSEYNSMTPSEVVKDGTKALVFLNRQLVNQESEDMETEIRRVLRKTVAEQFRTVEPDKFCSTLTNAQVNAFFLRYGNIPTEEEKRIIMKKLNSKTWEEKKNIISIIHLFQSYEKKRSLIFQCH